MMKATGSAGGGAGGGVTTGALPLTTGQGDAMIGNLNDRFGFAQPRGPLLSDDGVLSHARAVQGASNRFFSANQPGSRVETRSRRLTADQSPLGRSSTEVVTTIRGTQGNSSVTVRTVGLTRGQGGPRTGLTTVDASARGRNMNRLTRRQGEDYTRFGARTRTEVGRLFDRVALKTVEG